MDIATGKMTVKHQVSFGAEETIMSKQAFERECLTAGVAIQAYVSDNRIYTSSEFMKELNQKGQSLKNSGVGAHNQNGIAE